MQVNWEERSRTRWFEVMRKCEDEVRELLHDGCPVHVWEIRPSATSMYSLPRVNVGFLYGATLPGPARLLRGAPASSCAA